MGSYSRQTYWQDIHTQSLTEKRVVGNPAWSWGGVLSWGSTAAAAQRLRWAWVYTDELTVTGRLNRGKLRWAGRLTSCRLILALGSHWVFASREMI